MSFNTRKMYVLNSVYTQSPYYHWTCPEAKGDNVKQAEVLARNVARVLMDGLFITGLLKFPCHKIILYVYLICINTC